MTKFSRFRFQPVRPLGAGGKFVTGCKAHKAIALQGAADGAVLLKNDGTLPLSPGSRVCMFGSGTGEFLFGGGGSGQLVADSPVTLAQALAAETEFFQPLADFHVAFTQAEYAEAKAKGNVSWWRRFRNIRTPDLPEELYQQAVEFGGTAIFCISRFSSEGTDCGDRNGQEGDFDLWGSELALLRRLYRDFEKVVVVINTCGPVSVTEYENANALLYAPYGGSMGGIALKELLLGQRYPSGHLQDTIAKTLSDYPSTESFLESKDYVNYTEDIFVGYRYFETFAPEKVAYPFGFGLGYTGFALTLGAAALEKNTVTLTATVKNTGAFPGREVVQVYLEAPQGLLGKAKKVLCAFEKTPELAPGQETVVKLHFDIRQFGSFDDTGKICESAFVLEKGEYLVHVGTNVRDTEQALCFTLAEDIICKKCHSYMAPTQLPQRLTAGGNYEALPPAPQHKHPIPKYKLKTTGAGRMSLAQALEKGLEDDFLAALPDDQLCELVYGHAVTNAANCAGIGLQPRESWPDELYAGSDVKMPGLYAERFPGADRSFDPVKALADGTLDRGAVYAAAKRVLKLMDRLE